MRWIHGVITMATFAAVAGFARPAITPPASAGHTLVYADDLGLTLLLNAGLGGTQSPSRTTSTVLWGWDGSNWRVVDSAGPPVRNLSAAAYDSRRHVLVMHGGSYDENTIYGETWEWSSRSGWRRFTGTGPGPRDHGQMTYDADRGVMVLFGGSASTDSAFSDTWEFDGVAWRQFRVPGPAARIHHAMAFAPGVGAIVAGGVMVGRGFVGDTWSWNGERWSLVSEARGPRTHGRMTYDPTRRGVLLVGGFRLPSLAAAVFRDGVWESVDAGESPPARYLPAVTFDPKRNKVVMFGGGASDGTTILRDTWELDSKAWVRR